MSADKFADYFAEFCARSYSDEKYEMSAEEIVSYFNNLNIRKKDSDILFTAEDFIYDLQHNLCLLYHESGKYHFTHRSFQEYFCALFFSRQKDKTLERIGDSFEKRSVNSTSDKTFNMLYDMIPEKVEEYIFLPYLTKLFTDCSGNNGYWIYLTKYIQNSLINPRFRNEFYRRSRMLSDNPTFIRTFILNSVLNVKRVTADTDIPHYKEFAIDDYIIMELPNGNTRIYQGIPEEHILSTVLESDEDLKGLKKEDITLRRVHEYNFSLQKIAKNKEAYPDLIKFFESDKFQPHVDFYALKNYYETLKKSITDSEDDSLDFI